MFCIIETDVKLPKLYQRYVLVFVVAFQGSHVSGLVLKIESKLGVGGALL